MNNVLWIRFLVAFGFVGAGLIVYALSGRLVLARVKNDASTLFQHGKPAILYFTTPSCVPCKTIQRPAIQRLQEQMGDGLQIVEIDATARPELADEWGVFSVPTTFIIDAKGSPRHVNYGVVTEAKLWRQLHSLS